MKVLIKRVDRSLPLPEYQTEGAVGFDFVCRTDASIPPGHGARVPANVIVAVPRGYLLWVKERSSTLGKKGLLLTAGIIDQDYRGPNDEIQLQFYNPTNTTVSITRGERLAQGIFVRTVQPQWQEVSTMEARNRGGFGSSD